MELSGRPQGKRLELQLGSKLVRIYLLILDDLGPHRLSAQQPLDLYELVIARHRSASFAITSNRAGEEWRGGEAEIRVEVPLIGGWLPLNKHGHHRSEATRSTRVPLVVTVALARRKGVIKAERRSVRGQEK